MAPVHDAAKQNDVPALLVLLEGDPALVHAESSLHKRRDTPLHFACEAGAVEAAQLLLDRGAVIDKGNAFEVTALMLACCAGRAEVVSLLLARGADPALLSSASWTALIEAAAGLERPGSDHVAVLRLLLQDGRVAVNARTHRGATALSWACCRGHADRAHVLLAEGGADHRITDENHRTPMLAAWEEGKEECVRLLHWYEGELRRAFVLTKARSVVDDVEGVMSAAEKEAAKTRAERQRAKARAAPLYMTDRVARDKPQPSVEVVSLLSKAAADGKEGGGAVVPQVVRLLTRRMVRAGEEEEERRAVAEHVVRLMKEDLFVELMLGLRFRYGL